MNDNRRIALNTSVLYIKLIVNIIIGLYTSRVILLTLGVDDYGLYSVVGGIVTMMNFMGTAMLSTSYRFITVEMGKGANGNLNKVYNTVLIIHLLIAVSLILIGETAGTYYIKYHLNVAVERIPDALYVLRWSLFSTFLVIISYPSNGVIIAREKFVFTSSIEIIQSVLKLILVFALSYYIGNKLRMFALIMVVYSLILPISYTVYCQVKVKDLVKWNFNYDLASYKEIFFYAIWIMLGAMASMVQNQGAAILINTFFTLALNAAFGIATVVNSYVQMLVKSLGQATIPQITKSYSSGDRKRAMSLVFMISKYTFFMMLIPTVPLLISIDNVLILWLRDVPYYTNTFIFFMLCNGLVYSLECGFDTLIQATGKIRANQIGFSIIGLMVFPIAFFSYRMDAPPYIIILITIMASFCTIVFHTIILKRITDFMYKQYFYNTIIPAIKVLIPVVALAFLIRYGFVLQNVLLSIFAKSLLSIISIIVIIYFFGLSRNEKEKFSFEMKKILSKI